MRLATAAVVALVAVTATAEGASLKKLHQREHRQQASLLRYHGTLTFFDHHPQLASTKEGRRAQRAARIWTRVIKRELADTRRERRQHLAAIEAARASRERAAAAASGGWLVDAFLCIHRYEGSWTDGGGPYYGGLQMDEDFMRSYGWNYGLTGTADTWSPATQISVAIRAYSSGRGFSPWPTASLCGL